MPKSVPTTTCSSRILGVNWNKNTGSCAATTKLVTATATTATTAVFQECDCLQLYAVGGSPEVDDLSGFSSVHDVYKSAVHSFTSHSSSSMRGLPTASPAVSCAFYSSALFEGYGGLMPQVALCAPITRLNNLEQRSPKPEFFVAEKIIATTAANPNSLLSTNDKDDASSFLSLLSIEYVGLEHSLPRECISSGMPRPKVCGVLRKPQQTWTKLRGDFSVDKLLQEQDELHLPASIAPHSNDNESGSTTPMNPAIIQAINKGTPPSALVTQRDLILESSKDSSMWSLIRLNPIPELERRRVEPVHEWLLRRSSRTITRRQKSTASASSEINLLSDIKVLRKPSHLVPPAIRSASQLHILGSRIPSCGARASGLPRATRIGTFPRQSQTNEHTATSTDANSATVTDLLAEGARTLLDESREIKTTMLASSRFASTTGSVNNLTTTNGLQSRRTADHAVSAQSVCAASHKRERTVAIAKLIVQPQPAAQAKSGLQSAGTHSSASTYKPKAVTSGSFSSSLTIESADGSNMSTEAPKQIRGGCKSLTGKCPNSQKPDSRQLLNNVHLKPVYKPKSVENRTNSIPDGAPSSPPNP
ncbi:hypothetical protein FGIG_11137 [Fasciola gigantica]|uniref:Uncharacterized protein n=1 Tax=Fasciola gigantica TaxID=46835 RepID=A0A504YM05_FASGI|nr:hypothetical protein FGIG_11137 [Fasciola gigantica]